MNPIRAKADYQQFDIGESGITNIGPRMSAKMKAIKLPDLEGKEVLDVGCDFGFWSFQSALMGAKRVVGLDRGREVRNIGRVDLIELNREIAKTYPVYHACEFEPINIGRQWVEYGKFDVVYLFSLYHHIYENAGGDHNPIWFWLSRHLKDDGVLIWENPTTAQDAVVRHNVHPSFHANYNPQAIFKAAARYFNIEYSGPAMHETTRDVYICTPKPIEQECCFAGMTDGAKGASKAFEYANKRRCHEVDIITGMMPFPGSLNMATSEPFDWDSGYYRSQVLDVAERGKGLDVEWKPRWARFYPVKTNSIDSFIFRFEGESYPENFVEALAEVKIRDTTNSAKVTLCR